MIHQFDTLHQLRDQPASFYKETDVYIVARLHPKLQGRPITFSYDRENTQERVCGIIEKPYRNVGSLISTNKFTLPNLGATGVNKTLQEQGVSQWSANNLWGEGLVDVSQHTADDGAYQHALQVLQRDSDDFKSLSGEGRKFFLRKDGEFLQDTRVGRIEIRDAILAGNVIAIKRKCTNQSDALNKLVNDRPYFINLEFEFSQVGIEWDCGFNGKVEGCGFFGCNIGMIARFWLNATSSDNMFTNCQTTGDIWTNGNWDGASKSNSQSNSLYYVKNRHFTKETSHSASEFRVLSGLIADGNIYEGAGGDHAVIFDTEGSTVVRECTFRGLHLEAPFKVNMIDIKANSGAYVIDTMFCQYGNIVNFDVHQGYPELQIKNWVWDVYGQVQFKHNDNGCHWYFENNQFCPTWVDGVEPYLDRWKVVSDTYSWYRCGQSNREAPPQEDIDVINTERLKKVEEVNALEKRKQDEL